MSLSNPTANNNPTDRYLQWAGATGELSYYNKANDEKVVVPLPFMFRVLDQLSCVTGYMKGKGGFWSNEVRSTTTDKLVVRSKGSVEFEGLYKDLNVSGAKYATSVYFAYKDGEELKIGNIKLSGAALSAWIDFCKKNNVNKVAVALAGKEHGKNGTVEFEKPVFEAVEAGEENTNAAIELDKVLQEYLAGALNRSSRPTEAVQREVEVEQEQDDSEPEDDENHDEPTDAGNLDLSNVKF